MKYQYGLKKALNEIPFAELENLPTGALLARLKRLRWCYETPEAADDYYPSELETVKDKLLFKSDPRWKQAYRDLKTILTDREHIRKKI